MACARRESSAIRTAQPRAGAAAARADRQDGCPPGSRLPTPAETFVFWRWPLEYFERARARHGPRFTLRASGHPPFACVADPDGIKALSTAPADVLHPGEGGATIAPLIGDKAFMLLDGEHHMVGRKAVMPALGERPVAGHAELIAGVARHELASWPRGTPFALHERLHAMTLEVILRIVFARPMDAPMRALHARLSAMLKVTGSVVLSEPLLRRGPGRARWRRFLRERDAVDELIYELLDERCRGLARATHAGARCEGTDLLAALLRARNPDGSPLSRQQLRDNVMTVIVAGHETTASELEWAFQLLAHHPRALVRLLDEIDRGVSDEYMIATLQEVLRRRPAFLFTIPRAVKHPFRIDDWTYRAPAHLLGCIYLMHHDPQLYAEPHRFCPERFLATPPGPHTWLPWGGGRRRCPGRHLAMLQMSTVLRTVLSEVTVRPASRCLERARWRSVVVTPHAGSRVVIEDRVGAARAGRARGELRAF